MAISQKRGRRKFTGGRYSSLTKKFAHKGSLPTLTRIGEMKQKSVRTKGGNLKVRLLLINKVNVYDPKTKKYAQGTIEKVVENLANRNFIRRNILTKGTIIKTNLGDARVTSRPGQEGTLNAILV